MYKTRMGLRSRKNLLVMVLAVHLRGGLLTQEQVDTFGAMYRRCRTSQEQDQVTVAIRGLLEGWKTDDDRFSRILQDLEEVKAGDDEDEDPPALREALARSRVHLYRA